MTTSPRRALVIVDVQKDFCEGGSLAVAGGATVAAGISDLLRAGGYDAVVGTLDWHVDPGSHFSSDPDYVDRWPVHCVAGTDGALSHPALDTSAVHAWFRKGAHAAAYSGFQARTGPPGIGAVTHPANEIGAMTHRANPGAPSDERGPDGPDLAEWLRAERIGSVDVVGIATDHCVRATALDAVAAGFATRLLLPLVAGVAAGSTAAALEQMRAAGVLLVERI